MNRKILALSIVLLLVSCYKTETPKKPENLISKDQMINIIIDMSLLSSAKGVNKKILENKGIIPVEYIYKKHQIDSLQFALSNEYYTYMSDDYIYIYDRVKDSLEALKIIYNKKKGEDLQIKRKKDSLTKSIKKDSIKNLTKKKQRSSN